MRHIYLIALLLIGSKISAQTVPIFPIDSASGAIQYTSIVEVDAEKGVLYEAAKAWIARTYGDYKRVIQTEDKESGRLIFKGERLFTGNELSSLMGYTFIIDCKSKKYRCQVVDLKKDVTKNGRWVELSQGTDYFASLDSEYKEMAEELAATKKRSEKESIEFKMKVNRDIYKHKEGELNDIDDHIRGMLESLKRAMLSAKDF